MKENVIVHWYLFLKVQYKTVLLLCEWMDLKTGPFLVWLAEYWSHHNYQSAVSFPCSSYLSLHHSYGYSFLNETPILFLLCTAGYIFFAVDQVAYIFRFASQGLLDIMDFAVVGAGNWGGK